MNGCFVGPMPGFEKANLFSETPIVGMVETEGASQDSPGGSRTISGKVKFVSFNSMESALKWRSANESPDNVTTVKIYAFGHGEWRLVKAVAKPN